MENEYSSAQRLTTILIEEYENRIYTTRCQFLLAKIMICIALAICGTGISYYVLYAIDIWGDRMLIFYGMAITLAALFGALWIVILMIGNPFRAIDYVDAIYDLDKANGDTKKIAEVLRQYPLDSITINVDDSDVLVDLV